MKMKTSFSNLKIFRHNLFLKKSYSIIGYNVRSLFWLWIPLLFLFGCSQPYEFQGVVYDPPRDAPPIAGVNWDGTDFALDDLAGEMAVLFFGYTNCPDVCPITLAEMQGVATDLGQKADDVSFVFITVDIENDTPERLAQYVPTFNEDFYGIYMSEGALEEVEKLK